MQEVLAEALLARARALTRARGKGRSRARRLRAGSASRARPVPASASAVPWSTDVRTIGRPSVTFTISPNDSALITGKPWSWYIATTTSQRRERLGRERRVGGHRAGDGEAFRRELAHDGLDDRALLVAERAALARVRIQPEHERSAAARYGSGSRGRRCTIRSSCSSLRGVERGGPRPAAADASSRARPAATCPRAASRAAARA